VYEWVCNVWVGVCVVVMYGYVYVWDCNCEGGCNVWELYLCGYIGNV
jgi:hypothetical protein